MILLWISIPDLHFIHRRHFESYCVHMKSPRPYVHPDRQTDGNFFLVLSSFNIYKTWTFINKREFFFFHSCDYNTFTFYILRMWWESKKTIIMRKEKVRRWVSKGFQASIRRVPATSWWMGTLFNDLDFLSLSLFLLLFLSLSLFLLLFLSLSLSLSLLLRIVRSSGL